MKSTTTASYKDLNQEIDLSKIKYKKVKRFLLKYDLLTLQNFAELKSTCYTASDPSYLKHEGEFIFDKTIYEVWNAYKTISPTETWSGKMARFGLLYSRRENKIFFEKDPYAEIESGHILFLNLRILWGTINIAVGHEIKEVNEAEKFIRICYLENGKSVGTQFIRLIAVNNTQTNVIHETYYKSKSRFRDKLLYPYFHTKAIREFHTNVMNKFLGT